MAIFVETLLNGGNIKEALEDQALLDELDGDVSVDNSTALALAKAKADQTEDPVATSAQNVLTVSQEFLADLYKDTRTEQELEIVEIDRLVNSSLAAFSYDDKQDLCVIVIQDQPTTD